MAAGRCDIVAAVSEQLVTTEARGAVCIVRLNREAKLNAMSEALCGQLLAARHRAERLWAVSADRPLEQRPGLKGWVAVPVKKLLRPLLRWYVEPLAHEQRMFNAWWPRVRPSRRRWSGRS